MKKENEELVEVSDGTPNYSDVDSDGYDSIQDENY